MSLNPLNELKRRLDNNDTPLPKRLCLAKNVIQSHHFPSGPKERVVAEWLQDLTLKNKLSGGDLRSVFDWFNSTEDFTSELKSKFIQIVSQYLQKDPVQNEDVPSIISFLVNPKVFTQLSLQIEDSIPITVTLLQFLKADITPENLQFSQTLFHLLIKLYKESKKKLEFIVKLLDGENLETVFDYIDTDHNIVITLSEAILFPLSKKSFFASYLQTLVRKENIDDLIAEKGDNIQSVLKIMESFFAFPKDRTCDDTKFLFYYIDVFVSCFRSESQLIFAFYIMIANCLGMQQTYIVPAMNMTPITFTEQSDKVKRYIFLNMLHTVLVCDVDVNVKLTDTLGVKIPKVETKKTFLLFLTNVMMSQLKLSGKPDKASFDMVKIALQLDPTMIESNINEILPSLMISKKSSNTLESYTDMLKCLLETLFKLSKGTVFLDDILPLFKCSLETGDMEPADMEKAKNKIKGCDIFPQEIVDLYGKLTSDLMFRQNKDLLLSLRKNFDVYCLEDMKGSDISHGTTVLTEVMSDILSSFFKHNKMADHTVPSNIAEEFWGAFKSFEMECLRKFGKWIVGNQNNPRLTLCFLKLCVNFAHLKLLNLKYCNTKLETSTADHDALNVFDVSFILPCLSNKQWIEFSGKINDTDATLLLDEILLIKTMAIGITTKSNTENSIEAITATKTHILKQLSATPEFLETSKYLSNALMSNLDKTQAKQLAKFIIKQIFANENIDILHNETVCNNKLLVNSLLTETIKNILKTFDNADSLTKAIGKIDFVTFTKENDMKKLFHEMSLKESSKDDNTVTICVDILKHLRIYYLVETYQLLAIFMLLVVKKNSQKKIRRNVDHILQGIFELSAQSPDLYKVFPVKVIFSFKDKVLIDLLTLKIKTSNNLIVIKSLVESAVKRVKVESDLVKSIVDLVLTEQSGIDCTNLDFFSDPAFQISCIILPLIIKQKKVITISAYRSILADLQEKLHKSLLECFKNINYNDISSKIVEKPGNTDDSMVVSESTMASLNALSAYSLTLSKYCESTDSEETKNLDYLWLGLEYFSYNAVNAIQNAETKYQHIESSIQLINAVLRYIKKLDSHQIFQTKDKFFLQVWNSVKARLSMVLDDSTVNKHFNKSILEDIAVTIKFLCEWVSVEGFVKSFVGDLSTLAKLENPLKITKNDALSKSTITSHAVSKYLWTQILKANIVGPKCVALSKIMYKNSRNLKHYIQQHYELEESGIILKSKKKKLSVEYHNDVLDCTELTVVTIDDVICDVIRIDLETISEAVLAAKKITLDYKFVDSIFELHQQVQYLLGSNAVRVRCEISSQAFFKLFHSAVAYLNSLLVSREELLEDRWPCYMQCYRALVSCLCSRASSLDQLERTVEENLGELAHSIEKLTQSICKRKSHVSRIAAYTVADICSSLEKTVPSRNVRQHLENSISLLIQASDTTHAMAFLRRALAGNAGQMTMTNMYSMYKRYHKYVGNA